MITNHVCKLRSVEIHSPSLSHRYPVHHPRRRSSPVPPLPPPLRHQNIHAVLSSLRPNLPSIPAAAAENLQPSTGDSAVVLRSLGMLAGGDLLGMFEEENPSLAEAKEAFDVFDEDRDGFIKMKLENCRRMIALGDEDGDGRIDFEEFLRFLEKNLC